MKKILIVDDTPENLKAAEAFFATIAGFDFIYCTTRKEADEHFAETYAIITDRSLPYDNGVPLYVNFAKEENSPKEMPFPEKLIIKVNGFYLLLKAHSLGKPALMLTEHGDLGIGLPRENQDSASELVSRISKTPTWSDYEELYKYGSNEIKIDWIVHGISKTSIKAWEIAWKELLKQF